MRPYEGACPHSILTRAPPSIQPRVHKFSRLGVGIFFFCAQVIFFFFIQQLQKYRNVARSQNPPHIYAVADATYQQMMATGRNQCCVIR